MLVFLARWKSAKISARRLAAVPQAVLVSQKGSVYKSQARRTGTSYATGTLKVSQETL
jgi:hypothetical protein